jgi:hypothetical protein
VPVALPMLPIPWVADHRYVVRLSIDRAEVDRLRFRIRPALPARPPA